MIRAVLICLMLLPTWARAQDEQIVLGLSRDEVSITATFTGSELLIFGAVKRTTPPPESTDLGVIIAVSGPNTPVTIRKKDRAMGIWVNRDSVNLDIAPSFYAVATSGPMDEVLLPLEDYKNAISWDRAVRTEGQNAFDSTDFSEAFARIKEREKLFMTLEGAIDLEEDTLFRTAITLPANLTEGNYRARIFLTRAGSVIDEYDTTIPVFKVGIERWLYNLAQEQSAIYGALSLVIAALAGWAASAAFAAFRR